VFPLVAELCPPIVETPMAVLDFEKLLLNQSRTLKLDRKTPENSERYGSSKTAVSLVTALLSRARRAL
jgi:hypothetical protein